MAVLYRVNFRSEDFEEAFAARNIPFQVKDGSFLARPAARRMLGALGRRGSSDVSNLVAQLARRDGFVEDVPDDVGGQELTRQKDLARLIRLARQFDDDGGTVADFVADLRARFGSEGEGRGVNLLTYHRAKGLEFEAVFLPRLLEGELPFKRSKTPEAIAEERRLFYVGITRAKTHLTMSYPPNGTPSRFVAELDSTPRPTSKSVPGSEEQSDAFKALRSWRAQRARADNVPAFVVFHDSTLEEIARQNPRSPRQLAAISGIGPTKLDRYGAEVIAVLGELE